MIYYTRVLPDTAYAHTALSKADVDFSMYMQELGVQEIKLSLSDNLPEKFRFLNTNDIVIYQHPTFQGIGFEYQIVQLIRSYGAKVITFIHDSLAIRREEVPRNNGEIGLLNLSDIVIVHSPAMKLRLEQYGVFTKMIIQGLFGYRIAEEVETTTFVNDYKKLIYAGNLYKSLYLLTYSSNIPLEVFGKWPDGWETADSILPRSIHYHGEVAESELPFANFNGFGLSWDGWNVPDMEINGRYTKYNCSLKVSNYLAYGMPIVIWSGSAVAELLKTADVGIFLDDLNDLDVEIAKISAERYQELSHNAQKLSVDIRNGKFTKKAIESALSYLEISSATIID